ncbi:DUF1127 domain-containing protein [Thioclava indica]|uniref:YjiS-like domain-containing protein n=1 Tax=Thioclava indica TaxID=1353528 RepID=A0A074JX38_9RHOB|nr:DUF1127 domain-containing protein [Thioclava indica]KEO60118.1 hypothetical protein DT23_14600 [Thioclava indica]
MLTLTRTRPALARHAANGLTARVARALSVYRSRKALGKLDDRLLNDIGLSRASAQIEMRRFL